MGRYNFTERNEKPEKEIHPIWRAVGFAMIVIIPLMGFAAASLILDENRKRAWFSIPKDIIGPKGDPELWMRVIIAAAVMFVLYIIYMLIAFLLTKAISPTRYGPYDVPPSSRKVKRYKR